ncbi:MAG: hypothetical protein IJ621_01530 [Paludibacteraceae bacterium]|nr:hypothetical protein [Paludibacteraceae bacterium]
MKKIIFILVSLCLVASCKKNDAGNNPTEGDNREDNIRLERAATTNPNLPTPPINPLDKGEELKLSDKFQNDQLILPELDSIKDMEIQ